MKNVVSDQEREQAIAMFDDGHTVRGIARHLRRSPTTVSRILRAAGRFPTTEQTAQASFLNAHRANERRMDTIAGLLDEIGALRERAWEEHQALVKDRKHGIIAVALDEPPISQQLSAYQGIERAARVIRKLSKEIEASTNRQPPEFTGPIDDLVAGLKHLTDAHQDAEQTPAH